MEVPPQISLRTLREDEQIIIPFAIDMGSKVGGLTGGTHYANL
jgi:hypothetical protein